jgi:hypothetical protein
MFYGKKLITPPEKAEVKPIMIPKMVFEQLETKYDLSKLKKLEIEEIVDIVHKAKCGKLKGLDVSNMSKEDIITHLINSKCPEVHKMIVEITELNNELHDFINTFVIDGAKITKENIYYSGLQSIIIEMFFYNVHKNNKYDCIILPSDLNIDSNYRLSFRIFKGDIAKYSVDEVLLKKIVKQIEECIAKGVKLILIPIGIQGIGGGHANALIYRVDANTFERYEPHGSITNMDRYNAEYKVIKYMINTIHTTVRDSKAFKNTMYKMSIDVANKGRYYEHLEQVKQRLEKSGKFDDAKKVQLQAAFNKYEQSLENAIILNIPAWSKLLERYVNPTLMGLVNKLKTTPVDLKENINNHINEQLKKLVTETIPSISNIKNPKYIPPDLLSPERGLQSYEPKQLMNIYNLTQEEYENRIGGFCVLWSILYLELVLKFPNTKPSILNKRLLKLLMDKGEDAFAKLALGYLEGFKKLIKKFYKEENIDFTKLSKSTAHEAIQYTSKISNKLMKYFADNKLIPT